MPRSTNKPLLSKPVASTPQVNTPQVNTPALSIQQPSLFSSIKQGFGFGMGSSIAHNIFDSKVVHHVADKTTEFKQCMEKTYNNYDECSAILN
jgi:hypothetical protein